MCIQLTGLPADLKETCKEWYIIYVYEYVALGRRALEEKHRVSYRYIYYLNVRILM